MRPNFILLCFTLICIDMLVIFPNINNWKSLQTKCSSSDTKSIRFYYGIIAWIFIALGLYIFVFPLIYTYIDCITYGFLFGVIVFGIFDFTNMVIFPFYPLWLTFVDIISGCITCISTLLIYKKIHSLIKK